MEKKKTEFEEEKSNFEIDSSTIIENIDYEKLADLMSDEKFLKKFLESMPSSSKEGETKNISSKAEMNPPDLEDILEHIPFQF